MGEQTTIAWTQATANESWGCRKVDSACKNCYMFRMREAHGDSGTRLIRKDLAQVSRQISNYAVSKRLIFFDDMTDLFGEFNSFEYIEKVFEEIIETNDDRTFQLLTKRIGRAMVFYRQKGYVPRNVWQGCSIGGGR